MRTFVVVFVLLLVGIAALGFYQGWFRFSTDSTDQKGSVTFTVDPAKIKADRDKLLGQKGKEPSGDQTDKGGN